MIQHGDYSATDWIVSKLKQKKEKIDFQRIVERIITQRRKCSDKQFLKKSFFKCQKVSSTLR